MNWVNRWIHFQTKRTQPLCTDKFMIMEDFFFGGGGGGFWGKTKTTLLCVKLKTNTNKRTGFVLKQNKYTTTGSISTALLVLPFSEQRLVIEPNTTTSMTVMEDGVACTRLLFFRACISADVLICIVFWKIFQAFFSLIISTRHQMTSRRPWWVLKQKGKFSWKQSFVF